MQNEYVALGLALIGVIGLGCQWLAWQLKLPAILFLLIAGIIVGPITGLLVPQALLGSLLFPVISLAVAVILFEGSLTLNLREIKGVSHSVWSIISIGSLVSWAITSVATHYLLEFSWEIALLFGSLTVVTGPTVIVPLLRTVRPNTRLANILRWEGILIDPIGALFVVIIYEFIISSSKTHSFHIFSLIIAIGFSLGALSGYIVTLALRRRWIPEYLQPFAVLSVVLGIFAYSNTLEHESGLLTVTIMGMWLANAKDVDLKNVLYFKEQLTILFITGLFIILAARIHLDDFKALGWSAIVLFLIIQFFSRPISIHIATLRSRLNFKEKSFLAWVAPRGIVAASISSLFAIKLSSIGVQEADLLVPLTFMVIIGTVVLQSATARPLAILLNVAEPEPRGFLIIGANDIAREIALAIGKYNCRVVVTDSNWDSIRHARMAGLEHYFGNPISSHASQYLDLIGIGHVLAITSDKHFNMMACMQLNRDFEDNHLYSLHDSGNLKNADKHHVADEYHGRSFLAGQVSYKKLMSLIHHGEIKHTKLSEEFTYDDYLEQNKENYVIPLFTVNAKCEITLCEDAAKLAPKIGEIIVSLIKQESDVKLPTTKRITKPKTTEK